MNKLLQVNSLAAISTLNLNQVSAPSTASAIYDKPILSPDSTRVQTGSLISFILDGQLRTITSCLLLLWFDQIGVGSPRIRFFFALKVSPLILLSMHDLSDDHRSSDHELRADECHGIPLVHHRCPHRIEVGCD